MFLTCLTTYLKFLQKYLKYLYIGYVPYASYGLLQHTLNSTEVLKIWDIFLTCLTVSYNFTNCLQNNLLRVMS